MTKMFRDHVDFTFVEEDGHVQVLVPGVLETSNMVHIGDVWKSYGQSRRRRDHGAVVMKGWGAQDLNGKYLGTFHTRQAAADALEDERQGVRHR